MNAQDVIADVHDDAQLNQAFSRKGQSDWMLSLKRVARAQAILWNETPITERQAVLARVDAEAKETK